MAISFREALGIHPEALQLRAQRTEVLAANLANADTPHYKSRDIDFKEILCGIRSGHEPQPLPIMKTTYGHLAGTLDDNDLELKYRIPSQPSVDGNTVDPDLERTEFASNSVSYQSSLYFLNGKIRTMLTAIKGE